MGYCEVGQYAVSKKGYDYSVSDQNRMHCVAQLHQAFQYFEHFAESLIFFKLLLVDLVHNPEQVLN